MTKSVRLQGHDYRAGVYYFVTICAFARRCVFGRIYNDEMYLNHLGRIVAEQWCTTIRQRAELLDDESVVMPNHWHGIVSIESSYQQELLQNGKQKFGGMKAKSLNSIIAAFKAAVSREVKKLPHAGNQPLWQRGYYEHIIRTETALSNIRDYIKNNPANWSTDRYRC